MACSGCGRRRAEAKAAGAMRVVKKDGDLLGGYKYLSKRQIDARLAAYKRRFCSDCGERYTCDYEMYLKCERRLNK